MQKEWSEAFGQMTYGIYVLTTAKAEEINGMIASWVSQISYEPPLIMAAVHPSRYSHRLIRESQSFALHVLSRSQKDYLKRFKGPDPHAKFQGISWEKGVTGCPLLADCTAFLECELTDALSPGNHTLFIGKVVNGGASAAAEKIPLTTLDYEGCYQGKA